MDNLTELIRSEVKKQYRSVRQFAFQVGVPQTTVVSALKKGISGTGYTTVLKMCEVLHIRLADYETPVPLDDDVVEMVRKFAELDGRGQHTVKTVLQMEYNRCFGEDIGYAAAYGGKTVKNGMSSQSQEDVQNALHKLK